MPIPKPTKKSLSNLIPWKPGQSGNPSGRPKRQPISDAYRKFADKIFSEANSKLKKGATFAEAAAFAQFIRAIRGETKSITEIREAIEGKATQRIELAPDIEAVEALSVEITFKRPENRNKS